jgi:kinetochore protein Fta7
LTASLHSIQLLKTEIQTEENEVELDEAFLAELEKKAKTEEKFWKAQARKLESTTDLEPDDNLFGDTPDEIGFVQQDQAWESIFDDDSDLSPILSQLKSHLESIQSNSMQVQGIPDALADASLAVEGILQK